MWTNKVLKRDGTEVAFDENKIINAVMAAGASSEVTSEVLYWAYNAAEDSKLTVETLQAIIIRNLQELDPASAKRYKDYADARTEVRERGHKLLQQVTGILNQTDKELLNENANKPSEQIPVMLNLVAEAAIRNHYEKNVLPRHLKEAHNNGDLYIHDMGYLGLPITNCSLIDVAGMMRTGFKMGNIDIEPPKGLLTAANVLSQVVLSVSSCQFGGTTIPDIDLVLEPYAGMSFNKHKAVAEAFAMDSIPVPEGCDPVQSYVETMMLKEIEDAAQLMEHQIQTMMNSMGQVPFITFTFGKGESWFAREIQKAILKQRIRGIGKHKITPVFPKLVFWHKEGLNMKKGDPNYDIKKLAVECTARRIYPEV